MLLTIHTTTIIPHCTRDVYRIESIVSYRYHKTDTGIVSKWQKNNTFNNTFYDDIDKDRASLTQKWFFFLIKCMFCFSFLHHLENYGPWILLYCMLSITKGQKEKVKFLMVWYRIVSYWYRFVSIGILLYHKKIKGTHPYTVPVPKWWSENGKKKHYIINNIKFNRKFIYIYLKGDFSTCT